MDQPAKSLDEILPIEDTSEFCLALSEYEYNRQHRLNIEITDFEKLPFLLVNLEADILMEGFVDVFWQICTLHECLIIRDGLHAIGLHTLGNLFAEALDIYVGGDLNISEEAFKAIDPFDDDPRWKRFDEIGDLITAPASETRQLPDRLCAYIKANADQLR